MPYLWLPSILAQGTPCPSHTVLLPVASTQPATPKYQALTRLRALPGMPSFTSHLSLFTTLDLSVSHQELFREPMQSSLFLMILKKHLPSPRVNQTHSP